MSQNQTQNMKKNQTKKPNYHSVWVRPLPFWMVIEQYAFFQEKRQAYPIIRANQKGIFNRALHHVCFIDREKKIFVAKTLPDIADKNQSVLLFLDLVETSVIGWLKDLDFGLDLSSDPQNLETKPFQHIELPGEWVEESEVEVNVEVVK